MTDVVQPDTLAQEVGSLLDTLERRLLSVIQEGARGSRELADVLGELDRVTREVRQVYGPLHESLERRDLGFAQVTRLQATRTRGLWLYRKARLEHCFFTKLQLERGLRDSIYKQIVETIQHISAIEETEHELREGQDDSLVRELLGGGDMPPPDAVL
ncbi:MAG TPA: hypothetical protein VJT32_12555 [bacterium]|nr:hypothetical protein [bacterium]